MLMRGDNHKRTPVQLASSEGYIAVTSLLSDRGADTAVKDEHGGMKLHHTAARGHKDVVALHLSYGADVAA